MHIIQLYGYRRLVLGSSLHFDCEYVFAFRDGINYYYTVLIGATAATASIAGEDSAVYVCLTSNTLVLNAHILHASGSGQDEEVSIGIVVAVVVDVVV